MLQNMSVITQKLVQTGSGSPAEDIVTHRELMGISLTDEDRSGLTCPYVFPVPAAPRLAARLAGDRIDIAGISTATEALATLYDNVVIEGAGGLQVPLTDSITVLDYLAEQRYPTILVTSPRLGSINHTLMSLELLRDRGIPLVGLVYNRFGETDEQIGADSRNVFERYLAVYGFPPEVVDLPETTDPDKPPADLKRLI